MAHPLAGLGAEAGCDQFVVAPQRAVKEDQRSALKTLFELWGKRGAGREKIEIFTAGFIGDPQPKRIARLIPVAWGIASSRYQARLPGTAKGRISRPDDEPSASLGSNATSNSMGLRGTRFSSSTLKMLLDPRMESTRW